MDGADVDAITFNDDLMSGVMHLLLDIREGRDYYNWIDEATRKRADEALTKAMHVTLQCQIVVDGRARFRRSKDTLHETIISSNSPIFLPPSSSLRLSSSVGSGSPVSTLRRYPGYLCTPD